MPDTIPRLTDLEYLVQGLKLMEGKPTFEDLRLELIDVSKKRVEKEVDIPRSGYGVVRRLRVVDEYTYWSNAKDVLLELINLELIKKAPVPSKRAHVKLHRNRRYELTDLGSAFLEKLRKDEFAFRDALLEIMYKHHSHLRGLIGILQERNIYVPTYKLAGRFDDLQVLEDATVIRDAIYWFRKKAEQYAIHKADFASLEKKLLAKARNGSGMPKANLVDTINEKVESAVIASYDLPFDNVTFEHLYRLGQQVHIMNHGYLRDGQSPTLVVFSTAEITDKPSFKINRHKISDYEQRVMELIIQEFSSFGEPFVPIYDLRVAVCHKAKVNNEVFDFILQGLYQGKYDVDYQVALLRDMPGLLPPSAEPFRMGNQLFFNVGIVKMKGVEG